MKMAQESLEAAGKVGETSPRSSASRYYYSAYQAVSALLLQTGLTPPVGREAWSHTDTPGLAIAHLDKIVKKRGEREDVSNRLRILYKVRVSADYVSADDVTAHLKDVRKDAEFLVKIAKGAIG